MLMNLKSRSPVLSSMSVPVYLSATVFTLEKRVAAK